MKTNDNPIMLSITEAQKYWGLSAYFFRHGIKDNKIPYIQIGNKFYIPIKKFEDTFINF